MLMHTLSHNGWLLLLQCKVSVDRAMHNNYHSAVNVEWRKLSIHT